MPQFLTPLFWLAALGVAIPVIVHLVRRERSPRFSFSSLRFLRPASRRSIRYLKIRNPWLLVLRAILVLLLVAAFARPFIRRPEVPVEGMTATTSSVILLDNSYSMVFGGGFDRAVQEVRACLSRMNPQDETALVLFSDSPTVAMPFTHAVPALQGQLAPGMGSSYRTTDYVAALRLADKMLLERAGNRKKIYLITDLQRSGFRLEDQFRLSRGIQLELIRIPGQPASPISATGASLEITGSAGKREAKVAARFVRLKKDASGGRMTLLLNGSQKASQEVRFGADNTQVEELALDDWPEGNVRCELQAGTSNFFLVSGGKPKEQVLIVEGPAPLRSGRSPAYYLMRALSAGSGELFTLTSATVRQAEELPLQNFRVIFLAGTDTLPANMRSRLTSAVKGGTGLVLSPGISLAMEQFNSGFAELIPAVLSSRVGREREPVGVIASTRSRHPIFKVFADSGAGNFLASRFQAYYAAIPGEDAQVLARFDDGNPALIEREVGRGRVLLFTSSLDGSWNDLPLNTIYVPFVHQMALHAGAMTSPRTWYWIGEQMPLMGMNASPDSGSKVPLAYVRSPDQPAEELPLRDPFFTFTHPGIYAFRSNDQQYYRAANVRPEELELDSLDAEEFLSRMNPPPGAEEENPKRAKAAVGITKTDVDMGFYVLAAALLVLLFELWISGRVSRPRISG